MAPPRVLFVTYYFPPSGGPGVQRALKLARYLPEAGWQPTVLTVHPAAAAYPDLDSSLLREVPPEVQVERTDAWDPYALYARLLGKEKHEAVSVAFLGESSPGWKELLARWVRANLFLPDARVGWVPFAFRRGRKLLQRTPHDAIFTTGPPHSTHLAGWGLSRLTGLPWVADFRDLWTEIDYAEKLPTTALARYVDAALERAVLRKASAVTVVTPSWHEALAQKAGGRFALVRNGFDPADFEGVDETLDERFTIAHLGNLNDARNPHALWQALAGLQVKEEPSPPRVRLTGNVDAAVRASVRRFGLEQLVEVESYVPHGEAVRIMRRSALLLLVIDRVPNQEGRIPGKLYEYLAAGRPVLGLGPPEGDAAKLLTETGAGRMFDYEDTAGVARFLEAHTEAWQRGQPKRGADPEAVALFSRRRQAQQLAGILNALRRG